MAVNNITVTGKIGPGLTDTSQLFNDITKVTFDIAEQVLIIAQGSVITTFDLNGIATVTYSITSHIATLVAST